MKLSQEDLYGYRGPSKDLLKSAAAQVGDRIRVEVERGTSKETVEGLLMPRFQTQRDDYVVVKLKTGYNVGVQVDSSSKIMVLGKGVEPHFSRPTMPT